MPIVQAKDARQKSAAISFVLPRCLGIQAVQPQRHAVLDNYTYLNVNDCECILYDVHYV